MSDVYSKARERIAATDALALVIAGAKAVADAERKRRNKREKTQKRKAYKSAYDGVGGPGHEKMLERSRRYRERNTEKCREKNRRYYAENREKENERCRMWRKMKKLMAQGLSIGTKCETPSSPTMILHLDSAMPVAESTVYTRVRKEESCSSQQPESTEGCMS